MSRAVEILYCGESLEECPSCCSSWCGWCNVWPCCEEPDRSGLHCWYKPVRARHALEEKRVLTQGEFVCLLCAEPIEPTRVVAECTHCHKYVGHLVCVQSTQALTRNTVCPVCRW
jgi:hypothetical protein